MFSCVSPAEGPGKESPLRGPQLRVYLQRFPFPISGQLRASGSAHADMLPIPQPQLPESHPGWMLSRRRHCIHRFRLLSTAERLHRSHIQHQHWWVCTFFYDPLLVFCLPTNKFHNKNTTQLSFQPQLWYFGTLITSPFHCDKTTWKVFAPPTPSYRNVLVIVPVLWWKTCPRSCQHWHV